MYMYMYVNMYLCYMYVGFGKSKAGSWERTRHHTLATWVQVIIISDFQFTTSNQYQGQFSGQGYTFSLIPISIKEFFGELHLVFISLTADTFSYLFQKIFLREVNFFQLMMISTFSQGSRLGEQWGTRHTRATAFSFPETRAVGFCVTLGTF